MVVMFFDIHLSFETGKCQAICHFVKPYNNIRLLLSTDSPGNNPGKSFETIAVVKTMCDLLMRLGNIISKNVLLDLAYVLQFSIHILL